MTGLSLRNPAGALYLMLLIAGIAVLVAMWRKQLGVAALLAAAAVLAIQHVRFEALFAIVVVVVGDVALTSALEALPANFKEARAALISSAGSGNGFLQRRWPACARSIWSMTAVISPAQILGRSAPGYRGGSLHAPPRSSRAKIYRDRYSIATTRGDIWYGSWVRSTVIISMAGPFHSALDYLNGTPD